MEDRQPAAAADGRGAGEGGSGGPERLAALSDGVFAIAMTLLVLDVSVPAGLDDAAFHEALLRAVPNVGAYGLSFAVIAQFWRAHRQILDTATSADTTVTALTLLGLALVALLPFPTSLLAEYGDKSIAVAVYSGTVAATNLAHLALLLAVHGAGAPRAARDRRLAIADLVSMVAVFGVAVPLAFVSPAGAMWFWLALLPVKLALGRLRRRDGPAEG